jgi:hypothetical protein
MVEKQQTTTAKLTLNSSNGTKRWQFELAPEAPLNTKELREALVHEFVGAEADETAYELEVGGTLGKPEFILTQKKQSFIKNPESL